MKLWNLVLLGAVGLLLAGCELNEQTFNANRAVIRQHPALKAAWLARCERKAGYAPIEVKRMAAGYIHTDLKSMPQTVCRNLLKGYTSGRMQWIDFKTMIERDVFTPRMTQILRGG